MQNKQFSDILNRKPDINTKTDILNTRGYSSVSRHSYHSKQCNFFRKNIFHHQEAENKTNQKISSHIKSIADMYNSLYQHKMKNRFGKSDKLPETADRIKGKKHSEAKFIIRAWNPQDTPSFSKTLRN